MAGKKRRPGKRVWLRIAGGAAVGVAAVGGGVYARRRRARTHSPTRAGDAERTG